MSLYRFILYIRDHSPISRLALANVCAMQGHLAARPELLVVDVAARPDLAAAARIAFTPTLVLETPGRSRRAIGDFSDEAWTLGFLGVDPSELSSPSPTLPG